MGGITRHDAEYPANNFPQGHANWRDPPPSSTPLPSEKGRKLRREAVHGTQLLYLARRPPVCHFRV